MPGRIFLASTREKAHLLRAYFPLRTIWPGRSGPTASEVKVFREYDWTTGGPYDGNEGRKYYTVPRAHPLSSLVCACSNKAGNKRAFGLPSG